MSFIVYPTAKIIISEPQQDECSHKRDLEKAYGFGDLFDSCHFKHGENGDIGDFTFIRAKKLTLGEGVHIAPRVTIVGTGSVEVGDYSTIAPGVVIYTSVPDLRFGTNKYAGQFELKEGDVKIGKNCFIGANAVIAQGVTIGDNVIVGAHAYVNGDLEDGMRFLPVYQVI